MSYEPDSENAPMGLKHLPPSASTKDSLQALYEMQREIGSSMFELRRMASLLTSMTSSQKDITAHTSAELQAILAESQEIMRQIQTTTQRLGDLIPEQIKQIELQIHEKLDNFTEFTEAATEHQERVAERWPALMLAIEGLLDHFGYDSRTLSKKDTAAREILEAQERRRIRIWNAVVSAVVGIAAATLLNLLVWTWNKAASPSQTPGNPTYTMTPSNR